MSKEINVWKIASRWNDQGENNEEDKILPYFLEYNIVFAGRYTDYIKKVRKNDIIAVSDGITVKAVSKAIDVPKLLSEFGIEELEEYYTGDEPTIAIKVEIYELDKKEFFGYNRGTFHKVHGTYRDIVINLFKNKSKKITTTEIETCIKKIFIKNYNGIIETKELEIPETTKWIFLTGLNGFGKTSVLRAIMVGLQGKSILNLKEENLPEGTSVTFISDKIPGFTNTNIIESEETNFVKFSNLENLAAYGTKRTDLKNTKDISEIHENLFEYKNIELVNFEIRYKDWCLFPEKNKTKIQNFEKLLKTLLPNLSKIGLSDETSEVMYYELSPNDEELPPVTFNKLGMGMRSTIAMIADIVYRFSKETFEFEFDENNAIKFTGIVIIDEFDNHLHPQWQRDLIKKLSDLFPKVQFIVSTHSPIPLLGAPPERTVILNVNRTKEEGITVRRLEKLEKELKYLLPNHLLTSDIFGLEEIENVYLTDEEYDKVPIEEKYADIEKNKILMDDLEKRANDKELFPDDLFDDLN